MARDLEKDRKAQRRRYAANPEKMRETARRWRKANPESCRHTKLKGMYGITLAGHDALLAKHGGVCGICRKPETVVDRRTGKTRRLAVDHDAVTGKVRWLLCATHNTALGMFDHDPTLLLKAVDYLADPPSRSGD